MNPTIKISLFNDLERAIEARNKTAERLEKITDTFIQTETIGQKISGKLGLEQEIERLKNTSDSLRKGVFRLLVLGDMKRGKSTFLNALLGENLLPSDVSPCTALLTVIKYGAEQKVTVHYNDDKAPEVISFQEFKQRYTINPQEAKTIAESQLRAFPDVSHAVVEHPLPLLGKGIEFVDSPGLNDTEARNQLSLGYIYNCHAILFVLSASQPCTLEERRYLDNYLKDRGLNIFFLVNGWDRVREGLLVPEDEDELAAAEEKLRQVFCTNLASYCLQDGRDIYKQRVFEISALKALRSRIKNSEADLQGTGFPEFLTALNYFLTQERAAAELEKAKATARQACQRFQEAVERRIPLLGETVEELKEKIAAVNSDFEKLSEISQDFQEEILKVRDEKAKEIADSFKNHILSLSENFEADFLKHQPDLEFSQFFDKDNRGMFYASFKRAFEKYLNDRLAAWEFTARQEMAASFTQLSEKAAKYRLEYESVVETINKKLLGYRFYAIGHTYKNDKAYTWADGVMDVFSMIPDSLNRGINSFNYFWKSVISLVVGSLILQFMGIIFAGITIPVLGVIVGGIAAVTLQADFVRRQFMDATKKEFTKYLPQIAESQWSPIYQSIQDCFDTYAKQVDERVKADISARKSELDNLLKQKESQEIDIKAEAQRLKNVEAEILAQLQEIVGCVSGGNF